MFDKNDAKIEQERAEAEEKRQRTLRSLQKRSLASTSSAGDPSCREA